MCVLHVSPRVLAQRDMYTFPGLLQACQEMYDDNIRSPYLLAFIVDMYEEMLESRQPQEGALIKATEVSSMSLSHLLIVVKINFLLLL